MPVRAGGSSSSQIKQQTVYNIISSPKRPYSLRDVNMAIAQNLSPKYYMSDWPHIDKWEEINLQIIVWSLLFIHVINTSLRSLHTAKKLHL